MYLLENSTAYVKSWNRVNYWDALWLNMETGALLFQAEQDECENRRLPWVRKHLPAKTRGGSGGGWASPLATKIQYLSLQVWHRATLLLTRHTVAVFTWVSLSHSYHAGDTRLFFCEPVSWEKSHLQATRFLVSSLKLEIFDPLIGGSVSAGV